MATTNSKPFIKPTTQRKVHVVVRDVKVVKQYAPALNSVRSTSMPAAAAKGTSNRRKINHRTTEFADKDARDIGDEGEERHKSVFVGSRTARAHKNRNLLDEQLTETGLQRKQRKPRPPGKTRQPYAGKRGMVVPRRTYKVLESMDDVGSRRVNLLYDEEGNFVDMQRFCLWYRKTFSKLIRKSKSLGLGEYTPTVEVILEKLEEDKPVWSEWTLPKFLERERATHLANIQRKSQLNGANGEVTGKDDVIVEEFEDVDFERAVALSTVEFKEDVTALAAFISSMVSADITLSAEESVFEIYSAEAKVVISSVTSCLPALVDTLSYGFWCLSMDHFHGGVASAFSSRFVKLLDRMPPIFAYDCSSVAGARMCALDHANRLALQFTEHEYDVIALAIHSFYMRLEDTAVSDFEDAFPPGNSYFVCEKDKISEYYDVLPHDGYIYSNGLNVYCIQYAGDPPPNAVPACDFLSGIEEGIITGYLDDQSNEDASNDKTNGFVFCNRAQLAEAITTNSVPNGILWIDMADVVVVSYTATEPVIWTELVANRLINEPDYQGVFYKAGIIGGKKNAARALMRKVTNGVKNTLVGAVKKSAKNALNEVKQTVKKEALVGMGRYKDKRVKKRKSLIVGKGMYGAPQFVGVGDYTSLGDPIHQGNQLINNNKPTWELRIVKHEGDSMVIEGREFVASIYNNTSVAIGMNNFPVNPGLPSFLSRACQYANAEQYEVQAMIGELESVVCYTGGAMGEIGLLFNYNPSTPVATTRSALGAYTGSVITRADRVVHCGVECDRLKGSMSRNLFLRSVGVPSGQDIKTYDAGLWQVFTIGIPAAAVPDNALVANFYVTYRFKFTYPQLVARQGKLLYIDQFYSNGGLSPAALMSTSATPSAYNNGGGYLSTSNRYVFGNMESGFFRIRYWLYGSGLTGALGAPTVGGNVAIVSCSGPTFASPAPTVASSTFAYVEMAVNVSEASTNGGNWVNINTGTISGTCTQSSLTVEQVNPYQYGVTNVY